MPRWDPNGLRLGIHSSTLVHTLVHFTSTSLGSKWHCEVTERVNLSANMTQAQTQTKFLKLDTVPRLAVEIICNWDKNSRKLRLPHVVQQQQSFMRVKKQLLTLFWYHQIKLDHQIFCLNLKKKSDKSNLGSLLTQQADNIQVSGSSSQSQRRHAILWLSIHLEIYHIVSNINIHHTVPNLEIYHSRSNLEIHRRVNLSPFYFYSTFKKHPKCFAVEAERFTTQMYKTERVIQKWQDRQKKKAKTSMKNKTIRT